MVSEGTPAPPQSGTPVDYFLATIEAVAKWVTELDLDHSGLHRDRLLRLRRRLAFDADPKALALGFDALSSSLRLLSRGATEQQRMQVERTREMVAILRRATREFKTQGEQVSRPMIESAGRLAKLAGTLEAGPARTAIEREASEMRMRSEQSLAELKSTMSALQQEFHAVQHCMGPGAAAVIDRVTGLMARPEMERAIRERCEAARACWMILVRADAVEEFEAAGTLTIPNRALQQVGARFSGNVRPQDPLARWGPQEFLVIFDDAAQKLDRRAAELAEALSGTYDIDDGQSIEIRVEASVIEIPVGETMERALDRLRVQASEAIPAETTASPR